MIGQFKGIDKKLNHGNPNNGGSICGKLDEFLGKVDLQKSVGNPNSIEANYLECTANRIQNAPGIRIKIKNPMCSLLTLYRVIIFKNGINANRTCLSILTG